MCGRERSPASPTTSASSTGRAPARPTATAASRTTSARRAGDFSKYAPGDIAENCVEDAATTTPSETAGSGSDSSGGFTTLCGNDQLDPGEACDDGNRIDGDGCNRYCVEPGAEAWTVTFDGSAHSRDRAMAIAATADGSRFAISGTLITNEAEGEDLLVEMREAEFGQLIWRETIGGDAGEDERARGVAVDGAGAVYAGGWITTRDEGQNIWIRKYSPDGVEQWTTERDGGVLGDDGVGSLAIDPDDGTLVAGGEITTDEAQQRDIWAQRYDTEQGLEIGDPIVYQGPEGFDVGYAALPAAGSRVYITGGSQVGGTRTVWTGAYDDDGMELWTDELPNDVSGATHGVEMALGADGTLIVVGGAGPDAWMRGYDPETGAPRFTTTHNGPGDRSDYAAGIAVAPAGWIVVTGVESFGTQGFMEGDIFVHRYDEFVDGTTETWRDVYNGPSAEIDHGLGIVLPPDLGPIAVGHITVPGEQRNGWIRKYAAFDF